jgi:hypothetical protein
MLLVLNPNFKISFTGCSEHPGEKITVRDRVINWKNRTTFISIMVGGTETPHPL